MKIFGFDRELTEHCVANFLLLASGGTTDDLKKSLHEIKGEVFLSPALYLIIEQITKNTSLSIEDMSHIIFDLVKNWVAIYPDQKDIFEDVLQ